MRTFRIVALLALAAAGGCASGPEPSSGAIRLSGGGLEACATFSAPQGGSCHVEDHVFLVLTAFCRGEEGIVDDEVILDMFLRLGREGRGAAPSGWASFRSAAWPELRDSGYAVNGGTVELREGEPAVLSGRIDLGDGVRLELREVSVREVGARAIRDAIRRDGSGPHGVAADWAAALGES